MASKDITLLATVAPFPSLIIPILFIDVVIMVNNWPLIGEAGNIIVKLTLLEAADNIRMDVVDATLNV